MRPKMIPEEFKTTELAYTKPKMSRAVGALIQEHRLLWLPKEPYSIDHINRDSFDDRIENLRIADRFQQNLNQGPRPGKASQFLGVCFRNKDTVLEYLELFPL